MVTVAGSYPKTTVPTAAELRMLNRMSTGFTRGQLSAMRAAGGPAGWLDKQLAPSTVTEAPIVTTINGWYPDRLVAPDVKWQRKEARLKSVWSYARDLSCWTQLRRIYSNRTVLETMTDFWSGHFHIPANNLFAWPWRADYDVMIRANALGRFEDLLIAAALHPAMLLYLDNYLSVAGNPNENQGRELLELHTVGREAGYTEAMVRSSALILSGWTVDFPRTFAASYQPRKHTTGAVNVLGFQDANAAPDGRALTQRYLSFLAHHPATAQRIARKLATRFVTENPSQDLVDRIAAKFLAVDTDIKATLRYIVSTPEFMGADLIVRTGPEDAIATARVMGVRTTNIKPNSLGDLLPTMSGEFIYTWPRPDGAPRDAASLITPGRMLRSTNVHWRLVHGDGFDAGTTFRTPASWMPTTALRFDAFVDHLARSILGRKSTPAMLEVCMMATGATPGAQITTSHEVITKRFTRLVVALLDSPEHLSR